MPIGKGFMVNIKYITFILFLIVQTANAQQRNVSSSVSLSGMIVYYQRIATRELVEASDTLKFNRTNSLYTWHLYNNKKNLPNKVKQKFPGAQAPKNIGRTKSKQVNYFNFKKDSLFSRKEMALLKKTLYVKEKVPTFNWNITDSTKKIGNYTVKKATAHFRGRDYTAWFTSKIPISYGPWKLHGLPGLILQAYDKSNDIYFSVRKVSLNKEIGSIRPIHLNGNEKIVGLREYKEIMNNFEKYEKKAALKGLRSAVQQGYMDESALDDMTYHFPKVHFMEIFTDSTDN